MSRYLIRTSVWFVAAGLATAAAIGQPPSPAAKESKAAETLRELVQALGDSSSVVRDEAAAELLRRGPAAKDVLREARTDRDLEIRTRAAVILQRIEQATPAAAATGPHVSSEPTARQRALLGQLGDDSFTVREEAARELAELGSAAKGALIEGLKHPDLEVRRRARWILERVRAEEFDARLAAFVADTEGSQEHHLPGWKRYRELVGDSRAARELFAAMMRSDGPLLSAYEKRSSTLPFLFANRAALLQGSVAHGGELSEAVTPAAVATLLLIGSDRGWEDHARHVVSLYQLLNYPATKSLIERGDHGPLVFSLLRMWVEAAGADGSSFGMMMALKYELKETAFAQAKELIGAESPSPTMLHYAIIAIGRFGDEQDVPLLRPLLANKTVCHRWSNTQLKKNGTIDVQVRDAALVVILRLLGKDPKKHGFKLLRDNPETLYYVYTFGFIDDDEREAAHAKWAEESQAGGE